MESDIGNPLEYTPDVLEKEEPMDDEQHEQEPMYYYPPPPPHLHKCNTKKRLISFQISTKPRT